MLKTIQEGGERITTGTTRQNGQGITKQTTVIDAGVMYHQETQAYKAQLVALRLTRSLAREQEQHTQWYRMQ